MDQRLLPRGSHFSDTLNRIQYVTYVLFEVLLLLAATLSMTQDDNFILSIMSFWVCPLTVFCFFILSISKVVLVVEQVSFRCLKERSRMVVGLVCLTCSQPLPILILFLLSQTRHWENSYDWYSFYTGSPAARIGFVVLQTFLSGVSLAAIGAWTY